LKKGKHPEFQFDTHAKSIIHYLHTKSEVLGFVFDIKTMEFVSYEAYENEPGMVYGDGAIIYIGL